MNLFSVLKASKYWAEEYIIALSVISDPNQRLFYDDFFCLYSKNVSRLYFLNNRQEKEASLGYAYFKRKDSVKIYKREVDKILGLLEGVRKLPTDDVLHCQ